MTMTEYEAKRHEALLVERDALRAERDEARAELARLYAIGGEPDGGFWGRATARTLAQRDALAAALEGVVALEDWDVGVDGWVWTSPSGDEYSEVGDHYSPPPMPRHLREQIDAALALARGEAGAR